VHEFQPRSPSNGQRKRVTCLAKHAPAHASRSTPAAATYPATWQPCVLKLRTLTGLYWQSSGSQLRSFFGLAAAQRRGTLSSGPDRLCGRQRGMGLQVLQTWNVAWHG